MLQEQTRRDNELWEKIYNGQIDPPRIKTNKQKAIDKARQNEEDRVLGITHNEDTYKENVTNGV
jgi:hypothetical protein